jgi:hypothetical protein
MAEPDRISIQHILISFDEAPTEATRSQAEAETLANSVLEQAQAGDDFHELVRTHTDDNVMPEDPTPGTYHMLNNEVEGLTFPEFISGLNGRAQEMEAELVAKMKAGDMTTDELNEQMNAFLESLRMEADQKAPTMPYPRGAMVPAFGDVGFALEVGQVGIADFHSENSPFGWHIIRRVD